MNAPATVISPAPTANGDLHLGHIAGPFLAADIYTRYARAMGREVLFGTGVQDTSSYVVTTAHRLGMTPASDSLLALTKTITRIVIPLLIWIFTPLHLYVERSESRSTSACHGRVSARLA